MYTPLARQQNVRDGCVAYAVHDAIVFCKRTQACVGPAATLLAWQYRKASNATQAYK